MKGFQFLIFVILTFCCWGLYGPLLHVGQGIMGGGEGKSMLLAVLGRLGRSESFSRSSSTVSLPT